LPYKDYKGKGVAVNINSEDSDSSTDSVIKCVKQASLEEYLARTRGDITFLLDSSGGIASSSKNPVWIASDLDEIGPIIKSKPCNSSTKYFLSNLS